MDCPQTDPLSNADYLRQLNRRAAEQRIPLTGSIELTHRCNLRCVHCYLGAHGTGRGRQDREISTAQWLSILDQATEAGCLNLLITGGEPLLRRDFAAIYRHAKRSGLLVTVFTNGTLISDEIVDLFVDLPPRQVEISLYGATAETYEEITGVPGSFERCLDGIRRLLDARLHVGLKTILMTLNRQEFFAIQEMAEGMGVRFRFDAAISPCFNGDRTPLELRVPPREVVAMEMADEKRLREWRDFYHRQRAMAPAETLYQCGAGVTAFHVDPYGNLSPCLMLDEPSGSLLTRTFRACWEEEIPRLHDKKASAGFVCNTCEMRALCGYCPAFFAIETGAEDARSEYLCETGHLRHQAIVREEAPGRGEGVPDEHRSQTTEETALREAEAPRH